MNRVTIIRPDDWHLHLRDGEHLRAVLPDTARRFARAIVMPNLKPPVTTTALALKYRSRILAALPARARFEPLMTLYLTDNTRPEEIARATASGAVHAVKYYPAGATTHSDAGVTDLARCRRVLAPLVERFAGLKIVLEHVTTRDAVQFVVSAPARVAATITAHHLLINRNAMFAGGIRPHHYCLPVAKREEHRVALVAAATGGSPKFFLGTDSAPHARHAKEAECGCAGIYTAHAGIELYAEAFAAAGALDGLENFASRNGPQFYGLPLNRDTLTLAKRRLRVPRQLAFGRDKLVPFRAGGGVAWRLG